LQLSSYYSSN